MMTTETVTDHQARRARKVAASASALAALDSACDLIASGPSAACDQAVLLALDLADEAGYDAVLTAECRLAAAARAAIGGAS